MGVTQATDSRERRVIEWENGMKKFVFAAGAIALLAGGQALAADLPPPPAPPPRAPATYVPAPVPYYNWTGLYVGGNLGVGWNQGSFSDPIGNSFSSSGTNIKFLGGAQVGFNYEFAGGFLLGAEADFDFFPNAANTSNAINVAGVAGGPVLGTGTVTVNNGWLTTFAGRLGYAWDRFLVYGKGGWAWVGSSNNKVTLTQTGGTAAVFNAGNNSNYGWVAGAGVEYAFWGNVSARLEYDYIGLNNQTISIPATSAILANDSFTGSNRSIQMITAGINYKFNF
jgi:outer membrane immunogenic protein